MSESGKKVADTPTANQNRGGFKSLLAGARTRTENDALPLPDQIKAAERRAVQKSALVSVLVAALTGGLAVLLLMPVQKRAIDNTQHLTALEKEIDTVERRETQTEAAIPDSLSDRIAQMQAQINGVLDGIQKQAQEVAWPQTEPQDLPSSAVPQTPAAALTSASLAASLKALAGTIDAAVPQEGDISLTQRLMARLGDVLQVRKDGVLVTAPPAQAVVGRALRLAQDGNIAGAVATLKTLPAPALQAAQPWLDSAASFLQQGGGTP